jgi:hypothetical protein
MKWLDDFFERSSRIIGHSWAKSTFDKKIIVLPPCGRFGLVEDRVQKNFFEGAAKIVCLDGRSDKVRFRRSDRK